MQGAVQWLVFIVPFVMFAVVATAVTFVSRRFKKRPAATVADRPMSTTKGISSGKTTLFVTIFGSIFTLVGLGVGYGLAVRPAMESISARSWPTVGGVVSRSEVETHSGSSDSGPTYSINMEYHYRVDGRAYTGTRYDTRVGSSSGWDDKMAVVRANPPGTRVTVHYDPKNPSRALLSTAVARDVYFIGIFAGVFFIVGLLISTFGAFAARKASLAKAGALEEPVQRNLSSRGKRRNEFLGILIFALIWNGFVWPIFIFADRTPCLIPFMLIGIAVAGGAIYMGLRIFAPAVNIRLPDAPLRPGGRATVGFRIDGNIFSIDLLRFVLEGREKVTFRQGTNTRTERKTVWTFALLETTQKAQMERGTLTIDLPPDVMPSFKATNNAFEWVLVCRGEIPRRPDIKDEFEIVVLPAEVRS